MTTENEIDTKIFPPQNRYMVGFTSHHLRTDDQWITQNQRRFILADSPNDAREYFRLGELNDKNNWDEIHHKWSDLVCYHVPNMPAWAGYGRFGIDIRKNTG